MTSDSEPSAGLGLVGDKVAAELARVQRKLRRVARRLSHRPLHAVAVLRHTRSDRARRLAEGADSFALYRIVGNDLPPRHESRQSIRNLQFQLDHEPDLPGCEKWWIVNRIFDPAAEEEILALLRARGANHVVLPFDPEVYRAIGHDDAMLPADPEDRAAFLAALDPDARLRLEVARLRLKNLYVMNNNGARNAALDHGRARAKWVLPWDGNCFLTAAGWTCLREGVARQSHLPYHIVPMARIVDNAQLLRPDFNPVAQDEPQILFHREAGSGFDPRRPYGRRPKVDLLHRLDVWGPWMSWVSDPWDLPPEEIGPERRLYARSRGWVARLSSGNPHQEIGRQAAVARLDRRNQAILEALATLDRRFGSTETDKGDPT